MHGGIQDFKKLGFRNGFNEQNIYKTMIETKNDNLLNDEQIKTNSLFNETKNLNIKNQNTNCLIEYFEGMMLNYISLYENKGENMDKLKSLILNNYNNDNNTNTKIKGNGGDLNFTKPTNNVDIYNYLNFIDNYEKRIYVRLIKKIFNGEEYTIDILCMNEENNKIRDISFQISLIHNKIKDEICKCNDNIYGNNYKITFILEKLLDKLLNYSHQKRYDFNDNTNNGIAFGGYKYEGRYITLLPAEEIVLIKSIISLLIIILTLRNNTNKDIYKKYNYKYLLSSIYNSLFENNPFVFGGNNRNILTYSSKYKEKKYIAFGGDCALNTLLCVKKPELRELLMRKMKYVINNNITENYDEYDAKLHNMLIQLNNDKTNDLISKLLDYINDYKSFIKKIKLDVELKKFFNYMDIINYDYKKYKVFYQKELKEKGVNLPDNLNSTIINELIKNEYRINYDYVLNNIKEICRLYNKFAYVFINNVMDINIGDDIINKIVGNKNKIKEIYDKFENNNEIDNNDILSFKEIIEFMCDYKYYNIFYINLLISLILVKEKIDYVFDDEIIEILKYSDDKSNFVKCFENICLNRNEMGKIFPSYDEYNNEKYLFKYVSIEGAEHAVLSIIHVKPPNNYLNSQAICDIYAYDLNGLFICGSEQFNEKHWSTNKNDFTEAKRINALYKINNTDTNKRWILKHEKDNEIILDAYKNDKIEIAFEDITSHLCTFRNIFNNKIPLIGIVEEYNGLKLKINERSDKIPVFDNNYNYNLDILFKGIYYDYNANTFDQPYINIKYEIFKELLKYCFDFTNYCNNNYDNNISQQLKEIIYKTEKFINGVIYNECKIINGVIYNECSIKNLLFKFIKFLCMIRLYYQNILTEDNLNTFYQIIAECFKNVYEVNIDMLIKKLNFNFLNNSYTNNYNYINSDRLNNIIKNIINILSFRLKTLDLLPNDFSGGDTNVNNNYNSIIKRVLIILLIILIIIIIVLIVLYIINKYKNNDDFK